MPRPRAFYGWWMVGIGSFCYGFGISPMYYSWGFFLPEMRQEIALTETQSGLVFSVFSYIYLLLGPLVGILMARFGIRSVVVCGSMLAVLGFWLMSRADSFGDCLFAYGILGGLAIGLSTILPAQTLASNWFLRYRARAIAMVLAGGAIVGYGVNTFFGPYMLEEFGWRTGWAVIAGISAVVAVVAAIFIRSTPEDVGQQPDGGEPEEEARPARTAEHELDTGWSAGQAVRTYQFYVLVALSVAYGLPWAIIAVYGRLHLQSLGFATAAAGSILGTRVLASLLGRLTALGGDFISPQKLLGIVLLVEGVGSAGLIYADTALTANLCMVVIGLGFGAAYVSIPVTYSAFYGRRAFGTTVGARFAITGLVAPAAPTVAGMLSEWTGSYAPSFIGMAGICLVGGLVAIWLPHPGRAPQPALSGA